MFHLDSGLSTPLPSHYSESRLIQNYDNSLQRFPKGRTHAIDIESHRNPIPYRTDTGINPSFQDGYPSSRTNIGNFRFTFNSHFLTK